jgi:oligoendopeptidase F
MIKKNMGILWDLTPFFPQFNSPEFLRYKTDLSQEVDTLLSRADQIGRLNRKTAFAWEQLVLLWENSTSKMEHLSTYVNALSAVEAGNEIFRPAQAEIYILEAQFEKFIAIFGDRLKQASAHCRQAFFARRNLKEISFYLSRIFEQAAFRMSVDKEWLSADLNVSGFKSWGNLYNTLTGKLTFTLRLPDGKLEHRSISQWRGFLADADPVVRTVAYEAGCKAWETVEDICAAALNAISGNRLTLQRHRKIDHFLDTSLFQAHIGKKTLEAMYDAIYEKLDIIKMYYRIRTQFLQTEGIRFFEREAALPIGPEEKISWPAATTMLGRAFETVYPELGRFYHYMIKNRWIDSLSRHGKRPGAFCSNSILIGQQRIHMNFMGTLKDVGTLAHEMGHAWHAHLLKSDRPFVQNYPMTIAETASGFTEQLLFGGLLKDPELSRMQKLRLLDSDLSNAAVLLLDITVRHEFERNFYAERDLGEVTSVRLKEMMTAAQHRIYGDVLAADGADPLFWASKLHFYLTGVEFYNFPYTVGFLLARALYQRLEEEGSSFLTQYEQFLRQSGSHTVESLTRQALDVDITRSEFWGDILDGLKAPIARYGEMLKATTAIV